MGTPRDDFDLLLEAVSPVEAQLAKGVLAEVGIPVFVHSGDFDFVELGRAAHDRVRRPDVFVPKGALERARAALDEAWGPGWHERGGPGSDPSMKEGSGPA